MKITSVVKDGFCLFVILFFICLTGCTTYTGQANSLHDTLIAGQIDEAIESIDNQPINSDDVLANMNKGMLYRLKDDFENSNRALENAKQQANSLYGLSLTEQLGSVVINDSVRKYEGARYEQILLHAYMAMNYIQLDNLDAARVEMLQADIKMREWGDEPYEDPFIRYLSGMIYESLGEYDQAIVSYRYAIEAYKNSQISQAISIPKLLIKDLFRLLEREKLYDESEALKDEYISVTKLSVPSDENDSEIIVIVSNGLAPIKSENAIRSYAQELENTVRIALPSYQLKSKNIHAIRTSINQQKTIMELVENVDAIARATLNDEMPVIVSRAIARAVVKHKTQSKANKENPLSGILLTVTNLVTERADTRSWITLPQDIQLSRLPVKAGTHQLKIEMLNTAGFVVDRIDEQIETSPGEITFVLKHWIAPRPKPVDNLQLYKPAATVHNVTAHDFRERGKL